MSEFVDECRREWRRLGVPDRAANEMAADLAADLKEAEQDGVTVEEVLGEGAFDARAFAASWALERGLVVSSRLRDTVRDQRRLLATVALVVLAAAGLLVGGLFAFDHSNPSRAITDVGTAQRPSRTVVAVPVPDLLHLPQEQAISAAQSAGLQVRISVRAEKGTTAGTVLSQTPSPDTSVARGATITLVVARPPKH